MLQPNLYDGAVDLFGGFDDDNVTSEDQAGVALNAIDIKTAQPVVAGPPGDLQKLLALKIASKDSSAVSELRFSAQPIRSGALGPYAALLLVMYALVLLAVAGVDVAQCVLVKAADTPKTDSLALPLDVDESVFSPK